MMKLSVLLAMGFPFVAFASPILRTADVQIAGVGTYHLEVEIESQISGSGHELHSSLVTGEPESGPLYCRNDVNYSAGQLVFKLKTKASGTAKAQSQATSLASLNQLPINQDGTCTPLSPLGTTQSFYHPDQFVDFEVTTDSGQKALVSLSANFSGLIQVNSNGRFSAVVNPQSLTEVHWFLNHYENRGSVRLVDPSAPQVDTDIDPDQF